MKRRVKERSESALLSKGCCPTIMDASAAATACLERCHSSPSRSSAATMVQGSAGWFLENTKKVALLAINENKSSLPNPKTTNIGTAPRELKSPPPPHGLLIHTHLKGSCRRAHWVSRISLVKEVEQRTAFLASSLRIVCCFRITIEIRSPGQRGR